MMDSIVPVCPKDAMPQDLPSKSAQPDIQQPDKDTVNDFHKQLKQRVMAVCQYPPKSRERRRGLNQIVRLIQQSKKLWVEHTDYYEDALAETWLYFSRNLCEAVTAAAPYSPDKGSVTTWLNAYLKRRLQDWRTEYGQEQRRRANPTRTSEDRVLDPIDQIAASPDIPPLLAEVRAWAERDEVGDLRHTHVRNRPDINCQVLILRRLPPETKWKDLAQEFGSSVPTLSGFYEKHCRPRLRQFGEAAGYLDKDGHDHE